MENKRRQKINVEELETANGGFANGISSQLAEVLKKVYTSLNEHEKEEIISNPLA